MVEFKPIAHHIADPFGPGRLCDGQPANEADIPSNDIFALRQARSQAALCPWCQVKAGHPSFLLRAPHSPGNKSIAYLYTVSVQHRFEDIHNSTHCRENPEDRSCRLWEEARNSVRILHREARLIAREVTDIPETTGGIPATLYQFADGSVGYFAFEAPPCRQAGELTGEALDRANRVLQRLAARVPGRNPG